MKQSAIAPGAALDTLAVQHADWWSVVRERRSIRRYQDRPVERPLLEEILHAATWAPSAHNRQPWRFCVVTDKRLQRALSDQMAAMWRRDLAADGDDAAAVEKRVAISRERLGGAPALVLAALCMDEMDAYTDERRAAAEWTMGVQSVALACQNLLLAAHAAGLGACWMCAPLFAPDLVRDVLALPRSWSPQALITLGYPAETKNKERAPLASRVIWREDDKP